MTATAPPRTPSPPRVRKLRLDHLTVDHEVQRGIQPHRVRKLSDPFRPEAFGAPVVSLRPDGTHHIIDGQHRVAAAIASGYGDHEFDCLVYVDLSRAQEAAMFLLLNDRSAVNPLEKFLVRVVEGDEVANRLVTILTAHGWSVRFGGSDGSFAAVAALEKVANGAGVTKNKGNWGAVDQVMSILTQAWGHKVEAVRGELVTALGMVLLRYAGQLDRAKLLNQLASHEGGPRALYGRGKGLAEMRGGRVVDGIADVLVHLHNFQKRGPGRLPDWRTAA